jgi:hypothetical protein
MIGEVSWDPKKKTSVERLLVSILSGKRIFSILRSSPKKILIGESASSEYDVYNNAK